MRSVPFPSLDARHAARGRTGARGRSEPLSRSWRLLGTLGVLALGVAACETGSGTWATDTGTADLSSGPLDRTCDGIDEDRDGRTDEDYLPDDSCGVGYCRETNRPSSCIDGRVSGCQAGAPLMQLDRSCDGVDDDCDGAVDEEWSSSVSCGAGICKQLTRCVAGAEVCTPLGPELEVCDGLDNDCNGQTDEGQVCGDCVDIDHGTVISTGPWGACERFASECAETGTQTRLLLVCRAEQPVQEPEQQQCHRETEGNPCAGGGRCVRGQCRVGSLCPDVNDRFEDEIPIRVTRTSRVAGAICLADNADDRYRLTVPPRGQFRVTLTLDPGLTDQVRLWLYPADGFDVPPLQGGEAGLPELIQLNPTNVEIWYYLLVYNATRRQDVSYLLEYQF